VALKCEFTLLIALAPFSPNPSFTFYLKNSGDLAASRFDKALRSFVNIEVYPVRKPCFLKRGRIIFFNRFGFCFLGRPLKIYLDRGQFENQVLN
jgi:hypothetical protein